MRGAKLSNPVSRGVSRGVNQPITGEGGKPPAPPVPVWNELTEWGGANEGLGPNAVKEYTGNYWETSTFVEDPANNNLLTARVADTLGDSSWFEPNGLLVVPNRTHIGLRNNALGSWTGVRCTPNNTGGDPDPISTQNNRYASVQSGVNSQVYVWIDQAGSLANDGTKGFRLVMSLLGKPLASSPVNYHCMELTLGGNTARAYFDWQNFTLASGGTSDGGNLTVVTAKFDAHVYANGFRRAFMVVDVAEAETADDMVQRHRFKSADDTAITSTFTGTEGFNMAFQCLEISGTSVSGVKSGDWGTYPGGFISTATASGLAKERRISYPYTGSFDATFNDASLNSDGTQPLQVKGAYYVELTLRADMEDMWGIQGGGLGSYVTTVIVGNDDDDNSSDDGIDGLDSWRSKYLALQIDADGTSPFLIAGEGLYSKAANTIDGAGTGNGNYVQTSTYLKAGTYRICIVYDGDTFALAGPRSFKLFINGQFIPQPIAENGNRLDYNFSSFGNNCNGIIAQPNKWSAPSANPLGLAIGSNDRFTGSIAQSGSAAYCNVKNLKWWDEPLTDEQAKYMTKYGHDAWD